VAFAQEDSLGALPGTPTWYQPGIDVTVTDATLNRNLADRRQPDDPRPKEAREGNRDGTLTVEFTMTDTNYHSLIFPESTNTSLATQGTDIGNAGYSATWYLEGQLPGGTDQERFLQGGCVQSVTWNFQQGEAPTVELQIVFQDETDSLSTPSSISQPTPADGVDFHSSDLSVNSASVSKLQNASATISNMARWQRGQQQTPVAAVVGAYEIRVNATPIIEDKDLRNIAYGTAAGTSSTVDDMDTVTGFLDFDNSNGNVAQYDFSNLKPTTYQWSDLVTADADVTEAIEFHATDLAVS